MRIKPMRKLVIFILVVGVCFGGYRLWQRFRSTLMPEAKDAGSLVPGKVDLPSSSDTGTSSIAGGSVTLPGKESAGGGKPEVRLLGYAWNAQMGMLFANGGPQTTAGSFMAKHGV